MVGTEEHVDAVINLHQVFLSLMLDLEEELGKMTSQDFRLNAKL